MEPLASIGEGARGPWRQGVCRLRRRDGGSRTAAPVAADDASVDAVLEPLAGGIPASCWIIDHTTTMPSATGERARRWAGRGRVYLHAPVFMGPVNAAEGTGVMLLSGDPEQCARVLPDLERMTGKVFQLGPQPERAAAFKLFGNLTFLGMSA